MYTSNQDKNKSDQDYSDAAESLAASSDSQQKKKRQRMMAGEDLELNSKETTVGGQMEMNPDFTVEQAREAAKKEYNRRNSARSRVRSKKMVTHLQEECARLSRRERDLMNENEMLRSQLELYKKKDNAPMGRSSVYQQAFLPRASSAPAVAVTDAPSFTTTTGDRNVAASLAKALHSFSTNNAVGPFPGHPSSIPQGSTMFFQPPMNQQGWTGASIGQQQHRLGQSLFNAGLINNGSLPNHSNHPVFDCTPSGTPLYEQQTGLSGAALAHLSPGSHDAKGSPRSSK